jgi:hypothetical protein
MVLPRPPRRCRCLPGKHRRFDESQARQCAQLRRVTRCTAEVGLSKGTDGLRAVLSRPGAASTVGTHLQVVARSVALSSRGIRRASATAGGHGRVRDRG